MPSTPSIGNQVPEVRYADYGPAEQRVLYEIEKNAEKFRAQDESPKELTDDAPLLRDIRDVARRELAQDLKDCGVDEVPSEADVDKRVEADLRELSKITSSSQTLSPGRKAFFAK